jgi:hypothetical protein
MVGFRRLSSPLLPLTTQSIPGVIDSDSRPAIRAFEKAQGLLVTGLIDPRVLRTLKLPVPQIPSRSG